MPDNEEARRVIIDGHGAHPVGQPVRALRFPVANPVNQTSTDNILKYVLLFNDVASGRLASALVGDKNEFNAVAWLKRGVVFDFRQVEKQLLAC